MGTQTAAAVPHWTDIPGWLTPEEGEALAELARGKRVLEIGSYQGRSTVCMARTAELVSALDWGEGDAGAGFEPSTDALRENLRRHGVAARVLVHPFKVEEYGPLIPDVAFDLVFVDGAHDYESARTDLELARRVVKPGGTIALHDCDYPEVRRAARDVLGWRVGPEPGVTVGRLYYRAFDPEAGPDAGGRVVFLGLPRRPGECPTPDGAPEEPGHLKIVKPVSTGSLRVAAVRFSLLNYAFNWLWCQGLNARGEHGVTHFAMQHDDIVPAPLWCETLIEEMERAGADVCSAVVPIKDERGLTTTAVRNAATGNTRRLTLAEVHRLPETFCLQDVVDVLGFGDGKEDLLAVNTGLWVCRVDRPWADRFPGFRSCDAVVRLAGGTFSPRVVPEDWAWSEWLWREGLRAVATRKVGLAHLGGGEEFRNDRVWGTCETDPGDNPN